jgi:hypothetical protein
MYRCCLILHQILCLPRQFLMHVRPTALVDARSVPRLLPLGPRFTLTAASYHSGSGPRTTRTTMPPDCLMACISFGNLQSLMTTSSVLLRSLFSKLAIQISSWNPLRHTSVPHCCKTQRGVSVVYLTVSPPIDPLVRATHGPLFVRPSSMVLSQPNTVPQHL